MAPETSPRLHLHTRRRFRSLPSAHPGGGVRGDPWPGNVALGHRTRRPARTGPRRPRPDGRHHQARPHRRQLSGSPARVANRVQVHHWRRGCRPGRRHGPGSPRDPLPHRSQLGRRRRGYGRLHADAAQAGARAGPSRQGRRLARLQPHGHLPRPAQRRLSRPDDRHRGPRPLRYPGRRAAVHLAGSDHGLRSLCRRRKIRASGRRADGPPHPAPGVGCRDPARHPDRRNPRFHRRAGTGLHEALHHPDQHVPGRGGEP